MDYATKDRKKFLYSFKRKELIQEAVDALVITSLCLGLYFGLTTLITGV